MLSSLREFYDTFKGVNEYPYDVGRLAGVTGLTARWLPVIQEFDKGILDNRSMTEKTLFTEPHSSVVVHKTRISLFFKLKKGIWKTRHILVLSFLSAIIFAILVWFAVSLICFILPSFFHANKSFLYSVCNDMIYTIFDQIKDR